MGLIAQLDDAGLQAIADRVLSPMLSAVGFKSITARAARDHDGDQAVDVSVIMPSGSAIISARLLAEVRVALSKALEIQGDERLAYLSVDWPDDEAPPSPDVPT